MSKLMIVVEFVAIAFGLLLMGIMWVKNKAKQGINYIAETKPAAFIAGVSKNVQQRSMDAATLYISKRTPVKGTVSGDVKQPDQVMPK